MRFVKPNTAAVAAKVIDGEAIIMNLTSGAYYSMSQAGAVVWEMIERGVSLDALQNNIIRRYRVDPAQARRDVERLVDELVSEDLVVTDSGGAAEPVAIDHSAERETYQPPVLNKYTDMADLLALDPPMPVLPAKPDRVG